MKYTHVIWDFNGTILDDVSPCIDVLNTLLKKRGLECVDCEQYKKVFGFPIKDYYVKVGFDFSKEDYGVLADEWAKLYREATPDCGLCKGVKEALDYFKNKGMTQIILSATEKSLLQEQLVPLGIASYFSETLALDNLYAVSKVELGKEWIKRNKPQKALFIGDTEHDFETAAAMGVDCVLIANGHQNKERLSLLGVPVMNSASDLIKLF